jgi:O-antigen ligase
MFISFLFGYLIWLLLLILLGESFVGLYISGFGLFGGILWLKLGTNSNLSLLKSTLAALIGTHFFLIFATFFSSLFTHSLPLTILSLTNLLIGLTQWYLWLIIPKEKIPSEYLEWGLLLIGLVLVGISVGFQFYPALASLLPGMNLLHASYGHNHLAAYLLLTIPLAWYWGWRSGTLLGWIFPLVFTAALLFSFGRVAVVIGFVQFVILAWWMVRQYKNRLTRIHLLGLGLAATTFLIVLSIKAAFSLLPAAWACPIPRLEKQLCKPLVHEQRLEYWVQAIRAWRDYPLTGYGPGTFSLLNRLYKDDPSVATTFTHQAYLQHFAEEGTLGGVAFLAFIVSLWWALWRHQPPTSAAFAIKTRYLALVLGFAGICFDVAFDFDWNFVGIWTLSLLLTSLTLRDVKAAHQKWPLLHRAFSLLMLGCSLSIVTLATTYAGTELAMKAGYTHQVIRTFPYFLWHMKLWAVSEDVSEADKQYLDRVYHYHPEWWALRWLDRDKLLPEQRLEMLENWAKADPWVYWSDPHDLVEMTLEQRGTYAAFLAFERQSQFRIKGKSGLGYGIPANEHEEVKSVAQVLVNRLYQEGRVEEAVKVLELGNQVNEWVMSQVELPYLSDRVCQLHKELESQSSHTTYWRVKLLPSTLAQQACVDKLERLVFPLIKIADNGFGNTGNQLASVSGQLLVHRVERWSLVETTAQLSEVNNQIEDILKLSPWQRWGLWQELAPLFPKKLARIETLATHDKLAQTHAYLNAWQDFEQELRADRSKPLDHKWSLELARQYKQLADRSVVLNYPEGIVAYNDNQRIERWPIYHEPPKIVSLPISSIPTLVLRAYIEQVDGKKGEELDWRDERHAQMYLELIKRGVEEGELTNAELGLAAYHHLEHFNYAALDRTQSAVLLTALQSPHPEMGINVWLTLIKHTGAPSEWSNGFEHAAQRQLIQKMRTGQLDLEIEQYAHLLNVAKKLGEAKQLENELVLELRVQLSKKIDQLNKKDPSTRSLFAIVWPQLLDLDPEYWSMMQLGTFYVTAGDTSAARVGYRDCIARWRAIYNEDHWDCTDRLQMLDRGAEPKENYQTLNRLIRNEITWQEMKADW